MGFAFGLKYVFSPCENAEALPARSTTKTLHLRILGTLVICRPSYLPFVYHVAPTAVNVAENLRCEVVFRENKERRQRLPGPSEEIRHGKHGGGSPCAHAAEMDRVR